MNSWWERAGLTIEFNASSTEDLQGALLVGLGNPNPESTQFSVCLNQKAYSGGEFPSVSTFVLSAAAELHHQWRERLPNTAAIRKIVVEDFSLDTCLALLLFGAFLDQDDAQHLYRPEWLGYVNAWEQGRYLDGADVSQSAACLFSALGHSYMPESLGEKATDGFVSQGLFASLRFLDLLCRTYSNPLSGIGNLNSADYARAQGQLAHEQQMYQLALERGQRCQLLLPLAGSSRKLLVDALFLTETQPSGILKVLARTDQLNSWTHRGFGLLGMYRPGERGSGNDMVISLDPMIGAELGNLWHALEALENEHWSRSESGKRPNTQPRALQSYQDPDRPGQLLAGAPDQPWYDDGGRFTLLAAPKRINNGQLGTQLDWHAQVLPALWQQYFLSPVSRFVQVGNGAQQPVSAEFSKRVVCVGSVEAGSTGGTGNIGRALELDQSLLDTPTFQAWLAAQSMPHQAANSPQTLPNTASFEVQKIGDIDVIASRSGVTLFNRNQDGTRVAAVQALARQIASASQSYETFLKTCTLKIAEWTEELRHSDSEGQGEHGSPAPGAKKRNLEEWTRELMRLKAQALTALGSSSLLQSDFDLNELSTRLQRLWGMSEQRSELLGMMDRIDELMRHSIAMRSAKRQRLFGGVLSGLGLGLLASHVWEPVRGYLTTNMFEWQLKMSRESPPPSYEHLHQIAESAARYELFTVLIVLGFSLLGFILYWIFDIRGESE